LDQVTEELKHKVSAKTQQLSRYEKRQKQYYKNKMFRTDCKKFLQPSQTHKYQCDKSTKQRGLTELLESNIQEKVRHNEEANWIKNQR
jgi:hypothetical protein